MEAQEGYTCGFISSSSSLYIKVPRFQHGLNFQLQLCWDAQGLPLAGWATRDEARDRVLQGPPKEPRPSLFCLCLRLMSLQNQISRHCSQPDARHPDGNTEDDAAILAGCRWDRARVRSDTFLDYFFLFLFGETCI